MYYRNPIKIMYTTLLNDGIFRVHQIYFVFRFYVYDGTFDNPPRCFYLHVEQFLVLYALMGCFDLLRLLVHFFLLINM
jgi:hypothetical protein